MRVREARIVAIENSFIRTFIPKKLFFNELDHCINITIKSNDIYQALLINNIGINFIKTSYRCITRIHNDFIKSLILTSLGNNKDKFIMVSSAIFFNKIDRLVFLPSKIGNDIINQLTDIIKITTRIRYYYFISYSTDGYLIQTKLYKSQIKFNTNRTNEKYLTSTIDKALSLANKTINDIDDLIEILGIIPHRIIGQYNGTSIKNYLKHLLFTIRTTTK